VDQDQFIDEREQGMAAKLLYRRGHHKARGMLMAWNKQVRAFGTTWPAVQTDLPRTRACGWKGFGR